MSKCKNCYTQVDGRSAVTCTSCSSPLHKECAVNDGEIYCDICHMAGEHVKKVETIVPDIIRRSNIELYKKCPYSFYLQVIKGIEQPPTVYTQLGIDLHDLFDKASWDTWYEIDEMVEDYRFTYSKYPDEWKSDEMWLRAFTSIENFYKLLTTLPTTPFATEKTIIFDVGSELPKAQITMDRIDIDEYAGHLKITDYKTGKVMSGEKFKTDLQAPLYIHAVQKEYNMHVSSFNLEYLNEDKQRVFHHHEGVTYRCSVRKRDYDVDLFRTINEVQTIFGKIKAGHFNIPRDVKNMYFTCKMCHFNDGTTCRGAEEESWHRNRS